MKIKLKIAEQLEENIKIAHYEPTMEFLNSIYGDITMHNVKVMADGKQYVVDALLGGVLERHQARPMKDAKGNILWVGKDAIISPLDRLTFTPWKNP